MCVCEDPSWSFEFRPLPPHFTNIYTCEVTTTLKMHGSTTFSILHKIFQKIDD